MAFVQGEFFIVLHLLWHEDLAFEVSSKGPSLFDALYDTQRVLGSSSNPGSNPLSS